MRCSPLPELAEDQVDIGCPQSLAGLVGGISGIDKADADDFDAVGEMSQQFGMMARHILARLDLTS